MLPINGARILLWGIPIVANARHSGSVEASPLLALNLKLVQQIEYTKRETKGVWLLSSVGRCHLSNISTAAASPSDFARFFHNPIYQLSAPTPLICKSLLVFLCEF